jgi:hypothetical protein
MDRSGSRLKRFFIMGLTAVFLFGFFVPMAAAWDGSTDSGWEGSKEKDEFWREHAMDYMSNSYEEREWWWNDIYSAEDRINLARAIGRLEGEFGQNIWWNIKTAEIPTNTDLTNVDFSLLGPMYEWAKEVYEQNKSELTEAISQIIKGPNPELPGLWSEKKPYGDIYGSGDRILDDRGDEYIKQPDDSWAKTGNNYGPYKPDTSQPGGETAAASQPQPQPQPEPQPQPQPEPQPQPQPEPQPDPPQQGWVCPHGSQGCSWPDDLCEMCRFERADYSNQ